jgi:hypothetical protein
MWYGVEFVELELVVGSDVDISSLVLGTVAVLRRGEYWGVLAS